MTPYDPMKPVYDYAAPSNYVAGGASGLDLGPALTGCVCWKCGESFQRGSDGEIKAKLRTIGAVCEECAR